MDRTTNPFGEEWDVFVESVASAVEASLDASTNSKLAPNYDPHSVVKRMTYAFVSKHRAKQTPPNDVETAIDKYREDVEKHRGLKQQKSLRRLQKPFKNNSYYWVLLGLDYGVEIAGFRLGKYNVTRFATQLTYAHRHRVPQEYLIGFLLQTGTAAVARNAKNPDFREDWFIRTTQPA